MTIHVEFEPGDSIHYAAEKAQQLADKLGANVKFRFNGSDCIARQGGRPYWLVTNFEQRRENGIVTSTRKPKGETQ